jgi:hypothetical protein
VGDETGKSHGGIRSMRAQSWSKRRMPVIGGCGMTVLLLSILIKLCLSQILDYSRHSINFELSTYKPRLFPP